MSEGKTRETFEIIGMTCTGCARTLENEFRRFDGIEYAVSLADRTVTVAYAPGALSRTDFEQAIESHGYRIKGKTY